MTKNSEIIEFLRDLAANNNCVWFAQNKERYQKTLDHFKQEVAAFISQIGQFDEAIKYLRPDDCIFRIYRDTRFSPDKTPYKCHFGAYMAPQGGRKSPFAGYYLHVEPGKSLLSGGIYCPEKENLKLLRRGVDANFEDFSAIIEGDEFKRLFGGVESPEILQRVPLGFDANSPAANYLKYKHFCICCYLSDAEMCSNNFQEKALKIFSAMKPFNDFCNEALNL